MQHCRRIKPIWWELSDSASNRHLINLRPGVNIVRYTITVLMAITAPMSPMGQSSTNLTQQPERPARLDSQRPAAAILTKSWTFPLAEASPTPCIQTLGPVQLEFFWERQTSRCPTA